jgi:hypothetical protein
VNLQGQRLQNETLSPMYLRLEEIAIANKEADLGIQLLPEARQ